MVFGDILALAKAGYTPADVREFLAAEAASSQEHTGDHEPEKAPAEKTETTKPEAENVSHETLTPEQAPQNEPEQEPEQDYKKKFEDAQAALKKAQAANARQELPQEKSSQEIVNELFASIL